jgi:hypothetical protein
MLTDRGVWFLVALSGAVALFFVGGDTVAPLSAVKLLKNFLKMSKSPPNALAASARAFSWWPVSPMSYAHSIVSLSRQRRRLLITCPVLPLAPSPISLEPFPLLGLSRCAITNSSVE